MLSRLDFYEEVRINIFVLLNCYMLVCFLDATTKVSVIIADANEL